MRNALLWMMAMLAGCDAVVGIEDLHPPTIRGTVREIGNDNLPNVSVVLYRDPDGARIDAATTDGQGKFEFPITEALPFDGYLDVGDPGLVRTFSHLSQPVVDHADVGLDLFTLTAAGVPMLVDDAHATQDPARSIVLAQVIDKDGGAITGATVHARVAGAPMDVPQICYTDALTPAPCAAGTTRDNGFAWLFDIPETASLTITAVDGDGHSYEVSFPIIAGPSLVFTPVRPAP
jgi:hypothetical protein